MNSGQPATPIPDFNRPQRVSLSHVRSLEQLIGQDEIIEKLETFGELYAGKGVVPEHILLVGEDGTGKRTIARGFAKKYGPSLCEFDAKAFEVKFHLTTILSGLDSREMFSMLDVQSLRGPIAEMLADAIQKYSINLVIGQGAGSRIHPFPLSRFTFIATATKEMDCPRALLKHFSLVLQLRRYAATDLEHLASTIATEAGLKIEPGAATLIASACNGTPAGIESLLRRFLRLGKNQITEDEARQTLSAFGLKITPTGSIGPSSDIEGLSGIDFEKLVTSLLNHMGFQSEMTKASGDGGIDIVAVLDKPIVGGRYLIQCKRFSSDNLVGAPIIREFYGALVADQRAIKGILITTSDFTTQAKEFAQSLPIELIDGKRLQDLFSEYGSISV